ncbi:MAG: Gfo/Idh/MocA family oxidoreductase [Phycisphaerae bacterium]|nr:Gfo/Idh/MocA family oxidoreductase [Phycisphaerae bacterium]
MLRVGVVGCGDWGPNLIRAFNDCDDAEVRAVCDRQGSRVKRILKRYPAVEGYIDGRELIDRDDIDLVVVATPVDSHFSFVRAAVESGKHVLVEGPFTETTAEGEELLDRAGGNGVLIAVDHTSLFTPAVEKIRDLIEAGELGPIRYVDSVCMDPGRSHEENNVIWDLAPDVLSVVDAVLGWVPRRVTATGSCHTAGARADVACMHLDCGDGRAAVFHLNRLSPVRFRRTVFGGDQKTLVFDDRAGAAEIHLYDVGVASIVHPNDATGEPANRPGSSTSAVWNLHISVQEVLSTEVRHLIDAVERGRPLRVDGQAGLRVVRILEACDRSLRQETASVTPGPERTTHREPALAVA